jgi:hypothetical protein
VVVDYRWSSVNGCDSGVCRESIKGLKGRDKL